MVREYTAGSGKLVCDCLCGQGEITVCRYSLLSGNTVTCGCRNSPPIGSVHESVHGRYKVVSYTSKLDSRGILALHLVVKFEATGFERVCSPRSVREGSVKDLLRPSIAGVGYIGEGEYTSAGDDMVCYQTWSDMIKRCYSPKNATVARDYRDVSVCKEWHNFQDFAKWYYVNYVEGYHLDKDLRVFGSKKYSPDTCTFIPLALNSFLTGGLKRGITFNTSKGKWVAQCQAGERTKAGNKKQTYLGSFLLEDDALDAYKAFKLNNLSVLEAKYKDTVPKVLFENIKGFLRELK